MSYFRQSLADHARVLEAVFSLEPAFDKAYKACVQSLKNGGKLLFFGNGGSAADAQHLAAELAVRFEKNRRALAGLALTTDTSALTAIGNDFGFEYLFSRQLEALAQPQDVVLAFSTSGNSPNVVRALVTAKDMGLYTIALTGESGGKLASLADCLLAVPSSTTSRIQEMHIMLGHILCGMIESAYNE